MAKQQQNPFEAHRNIVSPDGVSGALKLIDYLRDIQAGSLAFGEKISMLTSKALVVGDADAAFQGLITANGTYSLPINPSLLSPADPADPNMQEISLIGEVGDVDSVATLRRGPRLVVEQVTGTGTAADGTTRIYCRNNSAFWAPFAIKVRATKTAMELRAAEASDGAELKLEWFSGLGLSTFGAAADTLVSAMAPVPPWTTAAVAVTPIEGALATLDLFEGATVSGDVNGGSDYTVRGLMYPGDELELRLTVSGLVATTTDDTFWIKEFDISMWSGAAC